MKGPFYSPRAPGEPVLPVVGTMNFGGRIDKAESERVMAAALERGCTFFDTANAYQDGLAETIVGAALENQPFVRVATKVGLRRVQGKVEGLSRAAVLRAAEESRKRLRRDVIDLYYLHAPDHDVPIEETLGAIAKLFEKGHIAAFGVSNFASWQVLEIDQLCTRMGIPRPNVAQMLYNLLIRQLDLEFFRFTHKYPRHVTVYNALAGGLLTGRYAPGAQIEKKSRFDNNAMYQRRYWSERFLELATAFGDVARKNEMTPSQLAYAWLASRPGVDSVLLGPASVEQLTEALDALKLPVSAGTKDEIDSLHRAFQGTDASYAR